VGEGGHREQRERKQSEQGDWGWRWGVVKKRGIASGADPLFALGFLNDKLFNMVMVKRIMRSLICKN